jgi:DNA polymerase-4
MDGIRDKFGAAALTRAVLMGRDRGIAMPVLPD